ncbi:hypothetical protein [Aeromonas hydrophila]|uniref:hypothetical protein n=1 Tax=Aeromonas hydrophila TaxID=644 RepID=UPI0009563BBD|nr:hypothetical protein [Aeromonas hydrophila]SIR16695.1 hypothetical protein SAMN05880569_10837 [Aeromonas hydrophila]SIR17046.1 hypothetical protein SAMN05878295_106113 [Aeromonas hydrophila]
MGKFTSRSAARAQHLQQQANNPAGAAISASAELFRSLDTACPGLTAAEAARRVIASEATALRRTASYQLLARLGPLLDKLEMVEKLG